MVEWILIQYLFVSGVGVMLFYLIDILLLRKSTLFVARRCYHLVAIGGSLLWPLVALLLPLMGDGELLVDIPLHTITITLDDVSHTSELATEPTWNWRQVLLTLWGVGALVTIIWLLIGFASLLRLKRRATECRHFRHFTLYFTPQEVTPFTIGRAIFIPLSLRKEKRLTHSILAHELEHIRQRHYRDLLLAMVLQPLQWWNPFLWNLLQQQRTNLEYLADEGVLRKGTHRKTYQYHLLGCTVGRAVELPSLTFSMQNLKKRIVMMNTKKKTNKKVAFVYALATLPVMALLLVGTQLLTIEEAQANPQPLSTVAPPPEKGEIFKVVDDMPNFPGGVKALMKYLSDNIQYPKEAIEANAEGCVLVQFIVETDGSISEAKVLKSIHEALDAEALRSIKAMPKWTPGKIDDKPVRVKFDLPIAFKLQGDEQEQPAKAPEQPAKVQ